jgi:AcrR family transcriptional regulator
MPTISSNNMRYKILTEAAKLFKQKGYDGASMRELAEKVGIEAASIYNHFKSKSAILESICFEWGNAYFNHINEVETLSLGFDLKMERLIQYHVSIIISNPDEVSVLNNDWKHIKEPQLTEFKRVRKEYERKMAQIIESGIEAGVFKPMNVSVTLFTILSSLRWVELWYKPGKGISKEVLAKDISTILLTGAKK